MKRFIKQFSITLVISMVFCITVISFGVTKDTFLKWYMITAGIILIGSIIINIIYWIITLKKMMKISKIITEDKNPEKFIEENERLLKKIKGKYYKNIININISAGYAELKQYEKAKEMLLAINIKEIKGINKIVYNLNLACLEFYLNKNETGIEIMKKNEKDFEKIKNHKTLGGNVMVLEIFKRIAENNYEEAKELLNTAKKQWTSSMMESDYKYLDKLIEDNSYC